MEGKQFMEKLNKLSELVEEKIQIREEFKETVFWNFESAAAEAYSRKEFIVSLNVQAPSVFKSFPSSVAERKYNNLLTVYSEEKAKYSKNFKLFAGATGTLFLLGILTSWTFLAYPSVVTGIIAYYMFNESKRSSEKYEEQQKKDEENSERNKEELKEFEESLEDFQEEKVNCKLLTLTLKKNMLELYERYRSNSEEIKKLVTEVRNIDDSDDMDQILNLALKTEWNDSSAKCFIMAVREVTTKYTSSTERGD